MDPHKEQLFRDVIVSLERAGHKQCVLNGSNDYSERCEVGKDVDLVSEDPAQIPFILAGEKVASIVRVFKGAHNTVYTLYQYRRNGGTPVFLELDACADCRYKGYVYVAGEEILRSRRPYEYFEVPSPELEFTCYLLKRLMKGLDRVRAQRLSELYREDPSGCTAQLARLFPNSEATLIAKAARSGDWERVFGRIEHLRKLVLQRARHEQPLGKPRFWLSEIGTRARARVRLEGLMVAFLGTDGTGKSTVTARVEQNLAPAFSSTERYHRPVETVLWRMKQRMRQYRTRSPSAKPKGASASIGEADGRPAQTLPSSAPPRKLPASLLKLGLWWADYTVLGYLLTIYPRLVKSTLVLFDRYYEDLLVYPRSYRYGGPLWLARFVGRLIPRPHLVILLDAPPEVIQARKKELTFEQTAYERKAYLKVVKGLSDAHVVDASKPLDEVVNEVQEIILGYMADRAAKQLGLRG